MNADARHAKLRRRKNEAARRGLLVKHAARRFVGARLNVCGGVPSGDARSKIAVSVVFFCQKFY